jgi:CHAT domain
MPDCRNPLAYPVCVELGGSWGSLLEQGRYAQLLGLSAEASRDARGLLALVRCRVEQGYSRAAADLVRSPAPGLLMDGDAGAGLRLWRGFLALYHGDGRPLAERAAEFSDLCDRLAAGGSAAVVALAADLRSRADVLVFVLNGLGPARRGPLVTRLAEVANGYRDANDPREAVAALRRAASFAGGGLAADRLTARGLLALSAREADEGGLVIAAAQAELELAKIELRALLDEDGERDQGSVLARFDEIAGLFRAGGHVFGDALAQWAVAELLLEYGNPAGIELARVAAAGFAAAGVPSTELHVWSALRLWYLVHGDQAAGRAAAARAAQLAPAVGIPLATEVSALDEANEAFRSGEIGRARSLLAGLGPGTPGFAAGTRVMLATSAHAIGLRAQARQVLEGAIADMTATGASALLGEAQALLSAQLMDDDPARALELLRSAADVAREAELPAEEAKYHSQLAWAMVVQRMRRDERPCLTAAADAEFAIAERLLAGLRTLEAAGEMVRLHQHQGQAAFIDKDWPRVGDRLTEAERMLRALGLLPDLAFVLSYQGLAMIEVARKAGPSSYDQAARLLGESQGLFRQVALRAMEWQVGFYRALCDIEAARWPDPAGERDMRLDRAGALMEESSALIDELRGSAEAGDAGQRQQAWMAFSADKQVFYGEGFGLAWDARSDATAAWQWLERMKGRALLDGLADGDGHTKPLGPAAAGRAAAARRSQPLDYAAVRDLLAAEEAAAGGKRIVVAEYVCTPERTMVFGARADWDEPRTAYVPLDYAGLRRFAAGTFRQPGGVRMMMEDLADGGLGAWHQFAGLLQPLARWAARDDIVYLVPYGILHGLPLHTLPLGGEPLLDRNPVCYAPAAAVLRHALRGRGDVAGFTGGSAAVFGDSRGNLTHARSEASAVARLLGVTPVLGDAVTRERVMDALKECAVLHVAGHGQLSTADGFASGLDLAGTDVLRAGDLLGRASTVRLAVLSGCDTGTSELRPGDEAVGLIRGLLLSGVRSVVASQWRVSDASTADLCSWFHQAARDPAVPLADALRRAARAVRDSPGHEHPYHWGGFALVGSWR